MNSYLTTDLYRYSNDCQNFDVNDAVTANIHLVIPVIDRNYNTNDIVTANLMKSRELSHNPGHSPELQYNTLIYIVIPVIDQNYRFHKKVNHFELF